MIPTWAVVRVHNPYWKRRGVRLWLPLFLLWIPLLLLAPLILLLLAIGCLAARVSPWQAIGTFWAILCGLSGTDVQVRADGNHVLVRLI